MLEAGTQGFRVNCRTVNSAAKEENPVLLPVDNNEIKTTTENGVHSPENCVHSPDQQMNLLHRCIVDMPDKTSTPVQSRPVRARHLVLSAKSPESPDIMPIPHAQDTIKNEKGEEANSPPDVREVDKLDENVMESGGFKYDTSDVIEYQYGSQDPLNILCSPVKVKRKRRNYTKDSSLTSGTLSYASKENVAIESPVHKGIEETKHKPSLGEKLSNHNEILPVSSSHKNLHPLIDEDIEYNTFKRESLCKCSFYNIGESNNAKNTCKSESCCKKSIYEVKSFHAGKSSTTSPKSNNTSLSEKNVSLLLAKTKTRNLVENPNTDKEYHGMTTFDDRKDIFSPQFSEQKRKSKETSSANKKRKVSKSIYPLDLGVGFEELNVSYTETIMSGNGTDKPTKPSRQHNTCSTPTNGLNGTQQDETSVLVGNEITCNTPFKRLSDKEGAEVAMPDSKRSIPVTGRENINMISVKQKRILSPTRLSNMNTFETTSRPSFQPVATVGGKGETYLRNQEPTIGKKKNECNDHTLQVVPVASLIPNEQKSIMKVTSNISVFSNTTENGSTEYSGPEKNMKMSSVTPTSELPSGTHSVLKKNQEAQYFTDSSQDNVPHIKRAEDLTTQKTEGQRLEVASSALNIELGSDTFSDINFSDDDFDMSVPDRQEGVTYDKNMKVNVENKQSSHSINKEELNVDLFRESHCDKNSGFTGFMSAAGKQVKISEKTLLQAKKLIEKLCEEDKCLTPQLVPPGNSVSSFMKGERNEKRNIRDMHETSSSSHCTKLESGVVNLALDPAPAATGNGGASAAVQNVHNHSRSNASEVKKANKDEFLLDESLKEIINADSILNSENKTTSRNINKKDNGQSFEVANSQVLQAANIRHSGKNSVNCRVAQSFSLKLDSTSDGAGKEAERKEGKKAFGRILLHSEESTMSNEVIKSPEDGDVSSKSSTQSNSNTFHCLSTAEQSRIKISKGEAGKVHMLWEEMQPNLNKVTNMECEYNIAGNKQSGMLDKTAIPRELMKKWDDDGSEDNEVNEPNNKIDTALDVQAGFCTAKGKRVFLKETSIAQARLLWQETANCQARELDSARAHKLLSIPGDNKHFIKVDEGHGTAKGKKTSVKDSIIAQAYPLRKETGSCEVSIADQGGPKEKLSISNDHEHHEMPSERMTTEFYSHFKGMGPVSETNLKNHKSVSEKLSDNEVPEQKEFMTCSRGNMSDTNTENVRVSRRHLSRSIGMSTVTDVTSSTESDVNMIKCNHLTVTPRRLLKDKHLASGDKCQSPALVNKNIIDHNSHETYSFQNEEVDDIEELFIKVLENAKTGSRRSNHPRYKNPLSDAMKDSALNLSVERNSSTVDRLLGNEVKGKRPEANSRLGKRRLKILEGTSHNIQSGLEANSLNSYENIQKENEASHDQSSMTTEFCGFMNANNKQVKISSKSLKIAQQLLQKCMSDEDWPENSIQPPFETGKSYRNTNNNEVATAKSFMVEPDQSTGVADETHEVTPGSPIIGSQRRSKGRFAKRAPHNTTYQGVEPDPVNIHGIPDISVITETFPENHLLYHEATTKVCLSQKKRSREQCQDEEDSFTSKKMKNVVINHHECVKGKSF